MSKLIRKKEKYFADEKREVLRLWQLHLKQREIASRTGISDYKVSEIIRTALTNGEIEEIRVIHGGAE